MNERMPKPFPRVLAGLLCLLSFAAVANGPTVEALDSIGLTVGDMERSLAFFSKVLNFEPIADTEVFGSAYEHLAGLFGLRARIVRMHLGDETIELTEYLAPRGRPVPDGSRSNDRWFQHIAIVVPDIDEAYGWLRQNKVRYASTAPQTLPGWNTKAAGIKAFYFKDPDDHVLEILSFPPDKGDPKWRRPASGRMFLGIDHTAIVVSDTETSLTFYRDTLGLKLVGESENYGIEQEHLNNVFGARLRITSLRAPSGPGVELLEYLTPRDGRPYPADAAASDLIHWQTNFITTDVRGAETLLRAGRFVFVSPGVVNLKDAHLGFRWGLTVRDPDGHGLRVSEK